MTFIAAEIGVNWRDLTEARRMIGLAKDAGADAIKFQIYKKEHVAGHPKQKELEEIILGPAQIKLLKEAADGCGIEFFATPFFEEAVDWLEEAGVKRYKIRYADRHNQRLLDKVTQTNKPMYISHEGIESIPSELIDLYKDDQVKIIYCVPKYPPKLEELALRSSTFTAFDGYSNHYPSIAPPLIAAARGAGYIEVHIKLDRYHPKWVPVDDAVSITISQLAELCRLIREIEKVEW